MNQLKYRQTIVLFLLEFLIKQILCQSNPICKGRRYICSQVINIESTLCAQVIDDKNKKIELWNCPLGYSCDFTDIIKNRFAYCQKDPDALKTLPGESCSEDVDCYSKKCTSGICVGALVNESCLTHNDCDVTLYCSFEKAKAKAQAAADLSSDSVSSTTQLTGVCLDQVTFGKVNNIVCFTNKYSKKHIYFHSLKLMDCKKQTCASDYDCQNNCVCNQGLCTYYYSLDVGIDADNKKACASGFVSDKKCAYGLSSKDPNRPKPCSSNKECVLVDSDGNDSGNTECQCGYNPGSFSYCSLSEGDPEYQNILTAFLFVLNTNFHCHTSLRYGPCKYIYDDEYKDYNRALNQFEMSPQITYNDYCIKRAFNWDYWIWLYSGNIGIYFTTIILALYFILI